MVKYNVLITVNSMFWIITVALISTYAIGLVELKSSPENIRHRLHELSESGKTNDIISYIESIEKSHGTLLIDNNLPSLYSYKAVALYSALRVEEAEVVFLEAVRHFPNDTRAWINLGEIQVQIFKLTDSIESFSRAYSAGDISALPRILRTKGWCASWDNFEFYANEVEKMANYCLRNPKDCEGWSTGGLEYTDASGEAYKTICSLTPNSRESSNLVQSVVDDNHPSQEWEQEYKSAITQNRKFYSHRQRNQKQPKYPIALSHTHNNSNNKRIKLGIISSDFGIHPVATLIRGFVQFIDRTKIELFCFGLHPKVSWWGVNITETVEHMVWLPGLNTYDAAVKIASYNIEILIDLNGHTMHSGLPIMSHKPAPIQMSFLGLPSTTAATFIDYYIADSVALPAEHSGHYSEKLLLMQRFCYIVNDYAQLQGDVATVHNNPESVASVDTWLLSDSYHKNSNSDDRHADDADSSHISKTTADETSKNTLQHKGASQRQQQSVEAIYKALHSAYLVFTTLSNSQKMDPTIFHVWMNVLRRFPSAVMLFPEYAGHDTYMNNLQLYARYSGVNGNKSIIAVKQTPWLDHLYVKTSLDLVLDTRVKNGHTTGLDGVWAGIPTISFAGGHDMQSRAGESIATALESEYGLAYSLKQYENMAFEFAREKKNRVFRVSKSSKSRDLGGKKENYWWLGESRAKAMRKGCKCANKHDMHDDEVQSSDTGHIHGDSTDNNDKHQSTKFILSPRKHHLTGLDRLTIWRNYVGKQRLRSTLFDTRNYAVQFTKLILAMWELELLSTLGSGGDSGGGGFNGGHGGSSGGSKANKHSHSDSDSGSGSGSDVTDFKTTTKKQFHIFASSVRPPHDPVYHNKIETHQMRSDESMIFKLTAASTDSNAAAVETGGDMQSQMVGRTVKGTIKPTVPSQQQPTATSTTAIPAPAKSPETATTMKQRVARSDRKTPIVGNYRRDERTTAGKTTQQELPPIPDYVFDGRLIMLNIGGLKHNDGWLTVNSQSDSYHMETNTPVDIARNMDNLEGLDDNSVAAIYSSHTLEHNAFGDGSLEDTLNEWFCVLRPGGILMISVPDLETLARMYLDPALASERWMVTKMIYGAQFDPLDYHKVGFDFTVLHYFLTQAGFCNIERVGNFNLNFHDTSDMVYHGYFISLNVAAKVCDAAKDENVLKRFSGDGFSIQHNASPYLGYKAM